MWFRRSPKIPLTLNVMGYCIGGTLLAMALACLAMRGDDRFGAATFIVSLQDFSRVGDTAMFLGEFHVDFIEQQMLERGYLDSREMSNMFNLLRSNDLIWSNVVNNYLLGLKPPAFDLLYWNSDGTRMARAAHSWYLRNTYVENNLIQPGKVQIKGVPLDLGQVRLDIYAVGAEKDHIVPWDAAWRIQQIVAGKTRYVLASSGHIAGIINPPGGKGSYWTNDDQTDTPARWRESAYRHEGSWWTDWAAWLATRSGPKRKPPSLGSRLHPPLQDAPGSYVLESSQRLASFLGPQIRGAQSAVRQQQTLMLQDVGAEATSAPSSVEDIEKYLGSGMMGIGPVDARKMVKAFGEKVFDIIEAGPNRLREVDGPPPAHHRCLGGTEDRARDHGLSAQPRGGTALAVRLYKS